MKKKNLFFFIYGHTKIKHDYYRFKISLLKKKFNVKFIVFPKKFRNIIDKIKNKDYYFLNNLNDFYLLLKNNKVSYVIDFIPNNDRFINFKKKLLKNKKLFFIKYETGLIPEDNKRFSFLYKIKKKIRNSNYFFKNYLYLISGLKSYYINKDLRSIPTWSCDYNEYLNYISSINYKKKKNNQTKYSVFIDEMIPDHPDTKLLKLKKISTAKKYYKNIGNFLSILEIFLGQNIKILLHPAATSNFYPKKFEVVQHKTCSEIAKSENVFLHGSTSVSYAVLFKKNIVYLTCKELLWMQKRIKYFQSYTGGQILNISAKVNKKEFFKNLKFNKEKYLNYVDNFIKHPKAKFSFDKLIMNIENLK